MSVLIALLPKDILLFELWKHARTSLYLAYCPELVPELTKDQVTSDINQLLANGSNLTFYTYYGRALYVDISTDHLDTSKYNKLNGPGTAEKIIEFLKVEELKSSICNYYKA